MLTVSAVAEVPAVNVLDASRAVTPVGAVPERLSVKAPLKLPVTTPQEICTLLPWPAAIEMFAGTATNVQTGVALITNVTETVRVTPPPVAVTVNG